MILEVRVRQTVAVEDVFQAQLRVDKHLMKFITVVTRVIHLRKLTGKHFHLEHTNHKQVYSIHCFHIFTIRLSVITRKLSCRWQTHAMLEIRVTGHSRASKVTPFDSLHMISYYRPIVTLCLECTIFEILRHIGRKSPKKLTPLIWRPLPSKPLGISA